MTLTPINHQPLVPGNPNDFADIYPTLEILEDYKWFSRQAYRDSRYRRLKLGQMKQRLTLDLIVGKWVILAQYETRPNLKATLEIALRLEGARP